MAKRALPKNPPVPLRIQWTEKQKTLMEGGSIESTPPFVQKILMSLTRAVERDRMCYVHLPKTIPMSLNQMYCARKNGGVFLHPDIGKFRDEVGWEVIRQGVKQWKPKGAVAAILGFYSPDAWVTDDGCVRKNDADNRVKPTLDALQNAMPYFQDETVWFAMAFKMPANLTCTRVWLYDTGPLVSGFNFG